MVNIDAPLEIAGQCFSSRLLVGTGKYANNQIMQTAIAASAAEIVTVSVRRAELLNQDSSTGLLDDIISPDNYTILPNTAGCYDADSALRVCQLARELVQHDLVKLEILGDKTTLFPDVTETLIAAKKLVKNGFKVMVYTSDDLIIARRLEDLGCIAIMPLAAPIGSGCGIRNPDNIRFIVEQISMPVIIDAGVGTASDAAIVMELGCDAVLVNTAIAQANQPELMAVAMKHAVVAGRDAYLAGRIKKRTHAQASSPIAPTF